MFRIVLIVLFASISILATPISQFRVIKEWNYINYTWINYKHQVHALSYDSYVPENNLMAGINFYDGYYYLAIPRMKSGIPVTLARINSANPRPAPLLEPYPSWEFNELGNCTSLQNVQNIAVDEQGRLWIIDGGKTGTLTTKPNTTCSAKLVIYDIKVSKIFATYTFPDEIANKTSSFLYDLVVDDSDGGYAYIVDNSRLDPGLIVFSLKQNTSWKVRDSKTMGADPLAVQFKINTETIRTPINIAGIALGPKTNINEQNITLNEDRQVYFCPISSFHVYSISTTYLKDKRFSNGGDGDFSQYIMDVGIKVAQSDGMKMDNKGILYYGLLPRASIVRWDSSTPFITGQQVIARDDNYIQWPNSFAFDDGGNILVLTNRLEKYIQNKMSLSEPNFRILMAYVDGKSYVYDDETLVYSVYETDNQNITANSTIISHGSTTPSKQETTTSAHKSSAGHTNSTILDHSITAENENKGEESTEFQNELTSVTPKMIESEHEATTITTENKKVENSISTAGDNGQAAPNCAVTKCYISYHALVCIIFSIIKYVL
ncbi:protein yellow-related [Holotrichia oblita]|uniref:Protein yellow-related n=1 Tax=Holotrichia oblita TaxID=644536 RepID=A0ACB9SKN7_HOLOL|nr:protein yellow-related [Holotrichia oblita]